MRKQSTLSSLWIRPYQLQLIDLNHPLLHTINCSTSTICVCWLIGKSWLLHRLVLLHLQWNLWFRERDAFAVCSNPGTARLPAVSCVARWGEMGAVYRLRGESASVSPLLCSPRYFVTGKQRSSEHAEWTVMSYFPKQLMFLGLNNHLSPSNIRHTASLTWLKKLLVSSDSCEKFGHQSESERLWSKSMLEISTSKRSWISRPDSVHGLILNYTQ